MSSTKHVSLSNPYIRFEVHLHLVEHVGLLIDSDQVQNEFALLTLLQGLGLPNDDSAVDGVCDGDGLEVFVGEVVGEVDFDFDVKQWEGPFLVDFVLDLDGDEGLVLGRDLEAVHVDQRDPVLIKELQRNDVVYYSFRLGDEPCVQVDSS